MKRTVRFGIIFLHSIISILPTLSLVYAGENKGRTFSPYTEIPDPPILTRDELSRLEKGEVLFKKELKEGGKKGRGIAIIHINRRSEDVWKTILNFQNYHLFMPRVKKTSLLSVNKEPERIDYSVEFLLNILGVKVRYFINHHYYIKKGAMIWELDTTKENDIKDTIGYWILQEVSEEPPVTRAIYSVILDAGRFIPSFVEDLLGNKELPNVVKNLKRYVESR